MSSNHDNIIENLIEDDSQNDLISFEDELLESDGARINTETVDNIEIGLRETDNVFNELQEVASRLAAHISPIESFGIEREIELLRVENSIDSPMRAESSRNNPREDRGVTFRDLTSNMSTNTTTSVVTAVSGMPPLYSLSNPSNTNNPSTQNSLQEYEGLGGGHSDQETQRPLQGPERPIQDSNQYQFLGLESQVLTTYTQVLSFSLRGPQVFLKVMPTLVTHNSIQSQEAQNQRSNIKTQGYHRTTITTI